MYKKIIAGAMCIFNIMFSASVYGAENTENLIKAEVTDVSNDGVVLIKGSISDVSDEKNVTLIVLKEGKGVSGILGAEDQKSYVSAFDDALTKEDGSFELKFRINGKQESGFYTARISTDGALEPSEYRFLYSNVSNRKTAIENLNKKTTELEVFEFVFGENGSWADLGFYTELQPSLDKSRLSHLIYNRLTEKGSFNSDDGTSVVTEYKMLEAIEALNADVIENIDDYYKQLCIDVLPISKWYNKSIITDDDKKEITGSVSNLNLQNAEDFENALISAVIPQILENADGVGTVSDILTEYEDFIGIDISKVKLNDLRKLMKNFAGISDIKSAYNALWKNEDNSKKTSGGVGGSSGGGASAAAGVSGAYVPPAQTEAVEVLKEGFSDLSGFEWAKEAIEALYEMGIINGKSEKEFAPADNIKREEFAKIIAEAFGLEKSDTQTIFADVPADAWYEDYVYVVASNGVAKGVSDTEFGVGQHITRQDMAVMIYNAAKLKDINLSPVNEAAVFADESEISQYAAEAVEALQKAGVINGVGNNMFAPKGTATRAEAAKMIYMLID